MDKIEIFKIRVKNGHKWVIIMNPNGPVVMVAKREDVKTQLLQGKPFEETETLELPKFLEMAKTHDILKQIANWKPFGLLQ